MTKLNNFNFIIELIMRLFIVAVVVGGHIIPYILKNISEPISSFLMFLLSLFCITWVLIIFDVFEAK